MLDFGFSEILLTSAIALVVLGPERLPKVARQVGNWMGRARAMARQLSEQLEREVNADELLKQQSNYPAPAALPDAHLGATAPAALLETHASSPAPTQHAGAGQPVDAPLLPAADPVATHGTTPSKPDNG